MQWAASYQRRAYTDYLGLIPEQLTQAQSVILPKSTTEKAINYTLNQWPELLTSLKGGDISIDNNLTERDIRPFTTRRKNWMFLTSVGEGKRVPIYTVE